MIKTDMLMFIGHNGSGKTTKLIEEVSKNNGIFISLTIELAKATSGGRLPNSNLGSFTQLMKGKFKKDPRPIYIDESLVLLQSLGNIKGMTFDSTGVNFMVQCTTETRKYCD